MRTLIAANWKMHGDMSWATKPTDFDALLPAKDRLSIDILICPPLPFVAALSGNAKAANVFVGGQNCHAQISGAHTGEVSAKMLVSAGADYVIVGHSERRAAGETDADVRLKAAAAQNAGLVPIICVGEALEVRETGGAEEHVGAQLSASMPEDTQNIVVAYEPIWAIGTGKVASVSDISDMHAFIRAAVGPNVRILYGGSVKPVNAKDILNTENVNGALIGGASLEMESLAEISKAAL